MLRSSLVVVVASTIVSCGDNFVAEPIGIRVSGNETASCAIVADGALYCWGRFFGNDEAGGEQGDPVTGLPLERFPDFRWRDVSVTVGHACGIRDDGSLWCWGRNCAGQLGNGTRVSSVRPVQVGTQNNWVSVATGAGHSCAIDVDAELMCWGGIDLGQQECSRTPTELPTRFPGTWRAVSSSFYTTHALALDDTLWRWNDFAIDEDPQTPHEPPMQLGTTRWRAIATGLGGVYGVRADRSLGYIQFDLTDEVVVDASTDWSDTIAARDHACALKLDGTLHCWGRNDMGQLGTGLVSEDVAAPIQLGTFAGWTALSAGWAQSCGVYQDQIYCWGMNGDGQLGIGMPYDHEVRTPQRIGLEL